MKFSRLILSGISAFALSLALAGAVFAQDSVVTAPGPDGSTYIASYNPDGSLAAFAVQNADGTVGSIATFNTDGTVAALAVQNNAAPGTMTVATFNDDPANNTPTNGALFATNAGTPTNLLVQSTFNSAGPGDTTTALYQNNQPVSIGTVFPDGSGAVGQVVNGTVVNPQVLGSVQTGQAALDSIQGQLSPQQQSSYQSIAAQNPNWVQVRQASDGSFTLTAYDPNNKVWSTIYNIGSAGGGGIGVTNPAGPSGSGGSGSISPGTPSGPGTPNGTATGGTGSGSSGGTVGGNTGTVGDLVLQVQPPLINKGDSCNITWSAQNAVSCALQGPVTSPNTTCNSGSSCAQQHTTASPALSNVTTYTLICQNTGGHVVQTQATCAINPSFIEK